jgi:hypothetical protein
MKQVLLRTTLTRRQAAAVLAAPLAARAQEPAQPATPAAELAAAVERRLKTREALLARQVPQATEPAFKFTA